MRLRIERGENMGRRPPELERSLCRHRLDVRHAADSVRAEDLFCAAGHFLLGLAACRFWSLKKTHSFSSPRRVAHFNGNFCKSTLRKMTPDQSLYSPFKMSRRLFWLPLIGV